MKMWVFKSSSFRDLCQDHHGYHHYLDYLYQIIRLLYSKLANEER